MKKIKKRSFCAISSALDFLGDKWSLLIIRDIIFKGKNTYSDFLSSDEKIATNILADRLLTLETAGIITKQIHPENKAKFLYKLTPKGIDLVPILFEIIVWSDKYLDISEKGKLLATQINNNKTGMLKKITENITNRDKNS